MLSPDYYFESIFMVDYQKLWDARIRALIFDLDNTLAPYDAPRPAAKVVALLKRLQRIGFRVCILTNNTEKRLSVYNENLKLPAVSGALKPLSIGVKRAMAAINAVRGECAIIGDQLFSDIWAGKNARITTVLVQPASPKDLLSVRWKRAPERWFIKAYLKRQAKRAAKAP
jgi:HAD superfamily phosphatase (TIGR01668 family)